MELVVKKHIRDYWSTDEALRTPYFNKVMMRKCFLQIMKMFHFADNDGGSSDQDRLWKVHPVLIPLMSAFMSAFKPYKYLCIDESLLLWKGRLSFKQYFPSERNRFGLKLYVLCNASTRYILRFFCVHRWQS